MLTRYRDSLRLGAALQIGFLKMSGRPLDAIQRVPPDLLKHLGEQIEVPAPSIATLRALYLRRRRTLYEHQRWAMNFLGLIRFEPTDPDKLLPALCDVVRAGVSGDQLLPATRRLLYEHRFVIPGTRRLSNLVQAATSAVDHASMAGIEREIPHLDAQSLVGGVVTTDGPRTQSDLTRIPSGTPEPVCTDDHRTTERQGHSASQACR